MNIIELKEHIENGTYAETLLILKYTDVSFIALQYIQEISKRQDRPIVNIESFSDIVQNIFDEDKSLYVMNVDKLDVPIVDDSTTMKIIVCKSIDKAVASNLTQYIIEIPKIEKWQTKALLTHNLTGLAEEKLDWLNTTIKDVYRLTNEMHKLSIFNATQQSQMFKLLNDEGNYDDFNSNTIFNFTNAIVKRDIKTVRSVLETIETIDAEPMGVLSILYKSFRNVIDIQLSANATPESTGMSPKQFAAVRYNVGKFNVKQLINIFDIVTSVDHKLKSGYLPHGHIIDYLVTSILK